MLSLLITPPGLFLLMFLHIVDQPDGRTKAEAQAKVLRDVWKHPLTWLWIIYVIFFFLGISGNLAGLLEP